MRVRRHFKSTGIIPFHPYFDSDHVDLTATVLYHIFLLLFSVGNFAVMEVEFVIRRSLKLDCKG